MTYYLAIDIGGTQIKYALIQQNGYSRGTQQVVTPTGSLEFFLEAIFSIIDAYKDQIDGIAFSVPGKVDTETGTIYYGGALTFLDKLCLKKIIEEKYGLKTSVQNDAKAAALAELWLGSLKGVENGAVIVLGTGVGGGLVLDGKLRLGSHFQAGELSLSLLNSDIPNFEKMVSYRGSAVKMVSDINMAVGNTDIKNGELAFQAINEGHKGAIKIFQQYCYQIACLILNLQAILDLEVYAIGGGISSQSILIEEIMRQFNALLDESSILRMNIPEVTILPTRFGNDANLFGALYTLLNQ